jgi:hypothetical protein
LLCLYPVDYGGSLVFKLQRAEIIDSLSMKHSQILNLCDCNFCLLNCLGHVSTGKADGITDRCFQILGVMMNLTVPSLHGILLHLTLDRKLQHGTLDE